MLSILSNALVLIGTLTFVIAGIGLLPAALLQALPLRIFGIMANDTLLAVPALTALLKKAAKKDEAFAARVARRRSMRP